MRLLLIFLLPPLAMAVAPASSGSCGANSSTVGTFQLLVQRPDGTKLPIRSVQVLNKDYKILYKPVNLPADIKKEARVSLVYMESGSDAAMSVMEMVPAATPAEWSMPARGRVLVFAFGPQGLDEKKVTNLVTKDKRLISQMTQYAEQTSQTEDNLELLSTLEAEDDEPSADQVRANSSDRMLAALVRALSGTNYGLDATGQARRAPIVSMKDKAMDGFFANAGGLFIGGGMLPDVKNWLFPETDFRSVFSVAGPEDSLQLCGRFLPTGTGRTKTVYLWAHRFSDAPPPSIALANTTHIPGSAKSQLPLQPGPDPLLIEKIRDWVLKPAGKGSDVPVRVAVQGRALEIDPRNSQLAAGSYQLAGRWDFQQLKVEGNVDVYSIDNLESAKPLTSSLDKLVTGSGPVRLDLEGADFQFVKRVALRRAGGQKALTEELDWQPPAIYQGPQKRLSVELDTDRLRPGNYVLSLSSPNGINRDLPLSIVPAPPQIDNLPIRLAQDSAEQSFTLKGRGLDRIESIASEFAKFRLAAFDPARPNERLGMALLQPAAKSGALLAMNVIVPGVARGIPVLAAMQVSGPKPRITSVKLALPENLGITPKAEELPAGSFISVSIKIEPADLKPALKLQCADFGKTFEELAINVGEKKAGAKLEIVGPGHLFLTFDPGLLGPSGCQVNAVLMGDTASDPAKLGRVIRFPRIEMFWMTDEKASGGNFLGILSGSDLELIERTGWDASKGLPVDAMPTTTAGTGLQQTLKVAMPWPSPTPRAPIYIWLRGESQGRLVEGGRTK